ncbi:hypothetical protein OG874_36625 [Nocardia sp. NBC_00565]|uniref:hypothetical protein n=1 Tax=Nocardia sp. NBC_00565 TaxID=2975993 RepID=UPI002E80E1CB|nr:hypothetical protein [Nocardia sp. NBC_00565]WUC02207.1 hypothetical protein OG874_36625 [Nocardia sp. NBC_00565]
MTEFHRVLAITGHAPLAFQATAGDCLQIARKGQSVQDVEPFDHKVIRAYRWSPDRLATLAQQAGFTPIARLVREPDPDERGRRAYLLLVKDR